MKSRYSFAIDVELIAYLKKLKEEYPEEELTYAKMLIRAIDSIDKWGDEFDLKEYPHSTNKKANMTALFRQDQYEDFKNLAEKLDISMNRMAEIAVMYLKGND